jgi:hypothetical protein
MNPILLFILVLVPYILMTLILGNLPFTVTELDVRDYFSQCGTLEEVRLVTDKETFKMKGYTHSLHFLRLDMGFFSLLPMKELRQLSS